MEETTVRLNEEFKIILKNIRPYIVKLTDPNYITFCRVWMEKLSSCKQDELIIRNNYLSELYRQIQTGKIEEPFLSPPPEGPLLELNSHVPLSSTSWSDISTTSGDLMEIPASGDSQTIPQVEEISLNKISYIEFYESKMQEQQAIISDLSKKNEMLMEQLNECNSKINAQNTKAKLGINMMSSEVEYLKERLRDLIMMNKNLQGSHNAIVMQWEDATRNLEMELRSERQKNTELQLQMQDLETKLEIETQNLNQLPPDFEGKINDKHQEEICDLKIKHDEIIKYMEDQHAIIINTKQVEFETELAEVKANYETKIDELQKELDVSMQLKNEEISRLEKVIEEQCDRSQMEQDTCYNNDTLLEKITFLQKCILKMEKLLRKYEKHYTKKINILTNELQLKENAIQLQLTTQRAQLLSKASSDRQAEIDEIVSQLEQRYRTLLEEQQWQVTDIRQEYIRIIDQLVNKFDLKTVIQ